MGYASGTDSTYSASQILLHCVKFCYSPDDIQNQISATVIKEGSRARTVRAASTPVSQGSLKGRGG